MTNNIQVTNGLVTTIIPVFNRPELICEAVESVLAQTYRPIEIIIVDDGSTDSTPAVIRELERQQPELIKIISQGNAGPGVAREAGRIVSRGEFIQYLDSDDVLLPGKFAAQVAALQAHPECSIAYGKTRWTWLGQMPDQVARGRTGEKHEFLFPSLLMSRWWFTNTPLYRRSLVDRIGPWKALSNEEDWEYDARAAVLGAKLCYCNEFVSVQRVHQLELHLCYQGSSDPNKLRDRAKAHELILGYARLAGIKEDQPEMQHFARELFLLSRQCGAANLPVESRRLFELARSASMPERARGIDFIGYQAMARFIGWTQAGRLALFADRVRSK